MDISAAKLQELKKALSNELNKDDLDYNSILDLSQKIVLMDTEHARFTVDSGLITRLGQELVSRQETAVAELVKNAYDADATSVKLSFINAEEIGGTLIIADDGCGMNRDELINGFMRISSPNKIYNPFSKRYHRRRAGQKGIGRFAVQRLGTNLTIITKAEDSDESLKLEINWNDYESTPDLFQVSHKITTDDSLKSNGTILIINGLRDKWSTAAVRKIYRYILDVVSPCINVSDAYPASTDKETHFPYNDNGAFVVSFQKDDHGKITDIEEEKLNIEDFALAKIVGRIDEGGLVHYSVCSKKLGVNISDTVSETYTEGIAASLERFDQVPPFSFLAYYFVLNTTFVPSNKLRALQEETRKHGGIRLYRNGFRILPYGEPGDDWLKLDKSVRDRVLLPPHGNNNFYGYVDIQDKEGIFCETSSREGLLETEPFVQLKNLLFKLIISAILRFNRARGVKLTTGQKKDNSGGWEPLEIKLKNIAHLLDEFTDDGDVSVEAKIIITKKKNAIKNAVADLNKAGQALHKKFLQERNRLRILTNIGLSVAQFSHEIKNCIDYIKSDLSYIKKHAAEEEKVRETEKVLSENFSHLYSYTSFFDEAISKSLITELAPLDIYERTESFRSSHVAAAAAYGVEILPVKAMQYRLFTKPMHPSEWASILFNLFNNSVKAIKRTGRSGKIALDCGQNDQNVFLEFSDTGDGIPEENVPHIFDAFFTTTAPQTYEEFSLADFQGYGLGLKIVKDIIDSYDGTIEVVAPPNGFATCFRIEIPKATEKDYKKYDL